MSCTRMQKHQVNIRCVLICGTSLNTIFVLYHIPYTIYHVPYYNYEYEYECDCDCDCDCDYDYDYHYD